MDLKEFAEIFKRENEFDRFNGLTFNKYPMSKKGLGE